MESGATLDNTAIEGLREHNHYSSNPHNIIYYNEYYSRFKAS